MNQPTSTPTQPQSAQLQVPATTPQTIQIQLPSEPKGMVSSNPSPQSEIILRERVRQARKSFDLAYVMTAFSAAIGLTGAVLMFSGQVPAGLITTTGSTSLTFCCLRLAKDANDRLDKLASDADDDQEK